MDGTGSKKVTGLAAEIGKRKPFDVPEQEVYLKPGANARRTEHPVRSPLRGPWSDRTAVQRPPHPTRTLVIRCTCITSPARWSPRKPDITRLIDRLEKSNLAKRQRCEVDRRVVWVTITSQGLRLLNKLDKPLLELHRRQLGHLGPKKLKTLSRLLLAARQSIDAEAD